MFRLDLKKAEEPEIKLPTSVGSLKKWESSRITSTSALLTTPKPLPVGLTNKLWKVLQEMGIPDYLTSSWEICMQVKEQQLEPEWYNRLVSNREYLKAMYCHPPYLTYMQSTAWEMLDWTKHKLESRLPGEISITSDMQMTPPLW